MLSYISIESSCFCCYISVDISFCLTGPYSLNGVPLRRVNQRYVIATSTKVNIDGVDVSGIDDKYFAKDKKKTKKGESEFFEGEEDVGF